MEGSVKKNRPELLASTILELTRLAESGLSVQQGIAIKNYARSLASLRRQADIYLLEKDLERGYLYSYKFCKFTLDLKREHKQWETLGLAERNELIGSVKRYLAEGEKMKKGLETLYIERQKEREEEAAKIEYNQYEKDKKQAMDDFQRERMERKKEEERLSNLRLDQLSFNNLQKQISEQQKTEMNRMGIAHQDPIPLPSVSTSSTSHYLSSQEQQKLSQSLQSIRPEEGINLNRPKPPTIPSPPTPSSNSQHPHPHPPTSFPPSDSVWQQGVDVHPPEYEPFPQQPTPAISHPPLPSSQQSDEKKGDESDKQFVEGLEKIQNNLESKKHQKTEDNSQNPSLLVDLSEFAPKPSVSVAVKPPTIVAAQTNVVPITNLPKYHPPTNITSAVPPPSYPSVAPKVVPVPEVPAPRKNDPTITDLEGGDRIRKVHIVDEMFVEFTKFANFNSSRGIETCGILAGTLKQNAFHITHLIIPSQEGTPSTCSMLHEEDVFEYQDKEDLMTIGWIHTSCLPVSKEKSRL
eukprot:TRINITY_DN4572_c0_g1_i1.p1 TRINITY_DN4572_c0_g1~~TRINITY_DN4572_c0_g1_i1.p1  ORF type:complete len:522 (+),score=192.26 TRINITY_DN4572_c0_g1_i1:132-1697(+)